MRPAIGPIDDSGSFTVVNRWTNPINVGVSCVLKTPGSNSFVPLDFYVSATQIGPSDTILLTPIDKVFCWFESDAVTSTMISNISGPKFTVDFTGSKDVPQTISYNADGNWQNGPLPDTRTTN
jgi:hypothetical protein